MNARRARGSRRKGVDLTAVAAAFILSTFAGALLGLTQLGNPLAEGAALAWQSSGTPSAATDAPAASAGSVIEHHQPTFVGPAAPLERPSGGASPDGAEHHHSHEVDEPIAMSMAPDHQLGGEPPPLRAIRGSAAPAVDTTDRPD